MASSKSIKTWTLTEAQKIPHASKQQRDQAHAKQKERESMILLVHDLAAQLEKLDHQSSVAHRHLLTYKAEEERTSRFKWKMHKDMEKLSNRLEFVTRERDQFQEQVASLKEELRRKESLFKKCEKMLKDRINDLQQQLKALKQAPAPKGSGTDAPELTLMEVPRHTPAPIMKPPLVKISRKQQLDWEKSLRQTPSRYSESAPHPKKCPPLKPSKVVSGRPKLLLDILHSPLVRPRLRALAPVIQKSLLNLTKPMSPRGVQMLHKPLYITAD